METQLIETLDFTLEKGIEQVDDFLNLTEDARRMSERDRDYYDHKQWTSSEAAKLLKRKQAPIVVNRIKPKVDGLLGLVSVRKSDPKAYPRTKKHEKASEACTDGLRYVADNCDFQEIKMEVANNFFVEGYGGAWVTVKKSGSGEVDVFVEHLAWDRIYFDPHSRKKDFTDARYIGFMLWMDEDDVPLQFPGVDVSNLVSVASYDETFEDRPRWAEGDGKRKRVRIAMHFYRVGDKWLMCAFSHGQFLIEPMESPYLDEFGQPTCPIELVGAFIDRDNNRYGEVRGFIDQQDEINHRRSKFLHMLSQRQTVSRKGAVKDIAAMKRELAKPDGHVEYQGEQGDFNVLPTGDMAQGQVLLYQDAKAELDAVSFNAQLAGDRQQGDLSGKAIDKLQQAGTIELNGLFTTLNGWEKRIYRQIWSRIKQFWTEEKWIRVTDDQDSLRWVGLNSQITVQQYLEEQINDESTKPMMRKGAAKMYTELMGSEDPAAQAELERIIDVRNDVAELDVDIVLDQSFDTVNVQQEQFQMLAQFGQGSDIDIIELIELSQLRGKEALIEKIEKRRQATAQAQGNIAEKEVQALDVKNAETMSKAQLNAQKTVQTQIENQLMIANPTPVTSVAV